MTEDTTPSARVPRGWRRGKRRRGANTSRAHGLHALERRLNDATQRALLLDERTEVGRALAEWKRSLVQDLGGKDALSIQQHALVDLAVRDRLLIESIDAWLLAQPTLVNGRRRTLFPALVERMRVADGYARRLQALGLERRVKPAPSLAEYLAARAADQEATERASTPETDAAPVADHAPSQGVEPNSAPPLSSSDPVAPV